MSSNGRKIKTALALALSAWMAGALWAQRAEARDPEDCQDIRGRTVRSYLFKNEKQGPEDVAFKPACDIEKSDKPKARVEAVMIGVKALQKLDPRGCKRFLATYVGISSEADAGRICQAGTSESDDALRKMIGAVIPPPPAKKK